LWQSLCLSLITISVAVSFSVTEYPVSEESEDDDLQDSDTDLKALGGKVNVGKFLSLSNIVQILTA
jgi:hypothetical protein